MEVKLQPLEPVWDLVNARKQEIFKKQQSPLDLEIVFSFISVW